MFRLVVAVEMWDLLEDILVQCFCQLVGILVVLRSHQKLRQVYFNCSSLKLKVKYGTSMSWMEWK